MEKLKNIARPVLITLCLGIIATQFSFYGAEFYYPEYSESIWEFQIILTSIYYVFAIWVVVIIWSSKRTILFKVILTLALLVFHPHVFMFILLLMEPEIFKKNTATKQLPTKTN